jgi:hypothetical protein
VIVAVGVIVAVRVLVAVGVSVAQYPEGAHAALNTAKQLGPHCPSTGSPHEGKLHWQQSVAAFGVLVGVAVLVSVGVTVGVTVSVGVTVGVLVAVEVAVGVGVSVAVGVGVTQRPLMIQMALAMRVQAPQSAGAGRSEQDGKEASPHWQQSTCALTMVALAHVRPATTRITATARRHRPEPRMCFNVAACVLISLPISHPSRNGDS